MGHIRLGRLPKNRNWRQVADLLALPDKSTEQIARQTLEASKEFLTDLTSDPGLNYSYWLLTQLTWQAKGDGFFQFLKDNGIEIGKDTSAIGICSRIADAASRHIRSRANNTIFSDIALQSLRESLTKLISSKSENIFGAQQNDFRLSLAELATQRQFSKLSRIYFSSFLNRYLQFFVSKEISNHVGPASGFKGIQDIADFDAGMKLFCFQSAKIVEDFSGGWYAKRNWKGDISESDVKKFIHVALKKIRNELALEGQKL